MAGYSHSGLTEGWKRQSSYANVTQITPLRHADGPGEYETKYRPNGDLHEGPPGSLAGHPALQDGAQPNYKPGPLRWPFLLCLILILLGCIGALEYACRILPIQGDSGIIPTAAASQSSSSATASIGRRTAAPVLGRIQYTYISNQTVSITSTITKDPPIVTTTEQPQTSQTAPSAPVHSGATETQAGSTSIVVVGTPPPDGYVDIGTKTLSQLVTTVVKPTTLDGVVSVVQGTTTLSSVVSTLQATTTLANGVVSTFQTTTTLSNVISTFQATTTLNGVVSSVAQATTLRDVVVISTMSLSYATASAETLTNSLGSPTATLTHTPPPVSTPTVVTLTDAQGKPTATLTTSALAQPITTTLTNSNGVATATVTVYPSTPSGRTDASASNAVVFYSYLGTARYFVGFFLPTILSVILTIMVRMIDLSAKQFQPLHELTHPYGARAHESLCLRTGGVHGMANSVRALFMNGQGLLFLTTTLTLACVFLVPVAAESVALKLNDSCDTNDLPHCYMTLGVWLIPARVCEALLGLIILLLATVLWSLRRWHTGVATNPWSIAGVASLTTNDQIRSLFAALPTGQDGRSVDHRELERVLQGRMFKLGYFLNRHGVSEYGIVIQNELGQPLNRVADDSSSLYSGDFSGEAEPRKSGSPRRRHLPFFMLSYTGRISFLLVLSGLLALILYYNNTGGDTEFEHFMSKQSFGVRFLFTLVGVVITFFWASFFTSVAVVSPYELLSQSPQFARRSILLSPPLNAFTGFYSAARRRHLFLTLVAFIAILSEFMPILLNNVPFKITQTLDTHMVCTWGAVGILSIMWLTILASFFMRWPHLPADPTTLAGAMFYVCDSWMLGNFEGLAVMGKKDRDWRINESGMRYTFGDILGMSGARRVGVDSTREA